MASKLCISICYFSMRLLKVAMLWVTMTVWFRINCTVIIAIITHYNTCYVIIGIIVSTICIST